MVLLLLVAQLFAVPITSAYALQSKHDVIVSVTYTDVRPIDVCTYVYAIDDVSMDWPVESHCWRPTSSVGDLDVWRDHRIDLFNFKVSVRYPGRVTEDIFLTTRLDT